jgi:hypothetical protein
VREGEPVAHKDEDQAGGHVTVLVEVRGHLYAVRTTDPHEVLDRCRAEGLRAELEHAGAAS